MQRKLYITDFYLEYAEKTYPAVVPGDVLGDLRRNGLIAEWEQDDDYEKISWVQGEDWTYTATFDLDKKSLAGNIRLCFAGVDTYATVWLNGVCLGTMENMFLRYDFDIAKVAKVNQNELKICLRSPIKKLNERKNNGQFVCIFNEDRLFLRKSQCHFGWDWAPEVAGYGIYLPVWVETDNGEVIRDVAIKTHTDGRVNAVIQLGYNVRREASAHKGKDFFEVSIFECLPHGGGRGKEVLTEKTAVSGEKNLLTLQIEQPKLWWPNGYGEPNLYEMEVKLVRNGKTLDEKTEIFGLKEYSITERPMGDNRLSCRINVNGIDVYAKGSNWVPCDFRTGLIPDEKYERLMELAREANFNMLRVWGGGIYEKDAFYRYCNENGIMVMQEFMVSCGDIPDDNVAYTKLLMQEAEYQVKRLKNHPCIAMWSGGNERSQAFGYCDNQHGYFESNIIFRGLVAKYADKVPYIDHSPWSYTDLHDDDSSGDAHNSCLDKAITLGRVDSYRDLISLRIPGFVSECAVLGTTRLRNIKKFLTDDKLWPLNEVWDKRLRCNPLAKELPTFMEWLEIMCTELFGEAKDLPDFIKKGMVANYEILYDEIVFLRANKNINAGFLNWMYNDIWGTATWSVVDYYNEPKGGYYAMKKAFAPVLLAYTKEKEALALAIVNDTDKKLEGILTYGLKKLSGEVVESRSCDANLSSFGLYKIYPTLPEVHEDEYYFAEFLNESTTYFPKGWKHLPLKGKLSFSIKEKAEEKLLVRVRAEGGFVRKVYLSLPEECAAIYSDNLFDLQAGEEKLVLIQGKELLTATVAGKSYLDEWDE